MNVPKDVLIIHKILKDHGKQLYVVGGCVRDHLMGNAVKDYDMATDAMPEEIKGMLEHLYRMDYTGESFGVIRVYTPEEPKGMEIATFRSDSYRERNFENFVEYIKEKKPQDYENRLHLLFNLSKNK